MFSLLSLLFRVATEQDDKRLERELKSCRGKLLWYEERYGSAPDDIDYIQHYEDQRNLRAGPRRVMNVLRGAPINDVTLWSRWGTQKDLGRFRFTETAIEFEGARVRVSISLSDIHDLIEKQNQWTFKTTRQGTWRFCPRLLQANGLTADIVRQRLSTLSVS